MTKDFADFLAALNNEGVDYVVIGGMAVLSYIPYRTTRDIDVLIQPTLENARKARQAVEPWRVIHASRASSVHAASSGPAGPSPVVPPPLSSR